MAVRRNNILLLLDIIIIIIVWALSLLKNPSWTYPVRTIETQQQSNHGASRTPPIRGYTRAYLYTYVLETNSFLLFLTSHV